MFVTIVTRINPLIHWESKSEENIHRHSAVRRLLFAFALHLDFFLSMVISVDGSYENITGFKKADIYCPRV